MLLTSGPSAWVTPSLQKHRTGKFEMLLLCQVHMSMMYSISGHEIYSTKTCHNHEIQLSLYSYALNIDVVSQRKISLQIYVCEDTSCKIRDTDSKKSLMRNFV